MRKENLEMMYVNQNCASRTLSLALDAFSGASTSANGNEEFELRTLLLDRIEIVCSCYLGRNCIVKLNTDPVLPTSVLGDAELYG